MKFLIALLMFFSTIDAVTGQSNKQIYGELLGNGALFLSVNYDQRLSGSEDGFGFRLGMSVVNISPAEFTFPIMLNYLVGKNHQLELGAGLLILTRNISFNTGNNLTGTALTASLMYRYNFSNGYVFRFGYTPIIDSDSSFGLWFGTSVGYRF